MDANRVIEQINDHILSIAENFIEFKKMGSNFMGCCPFHNEKTPSLSVNPAKGIFKCFGCGKGGNAIEFIKEHEGVEFKEAVVIGAKKLNIGFEWKKSSNFDEAKYRHEESLKIACGVVEKFFLQQVSQKEAQQYIKERKLAIPQDSSFNIGYAPNGNALLAHARKSGLKTEILEEIGVLKSNDKGVYDFFRNRLIFPISNSRGQTIAFAGRDLNKEPKIKYINTPESCIYTKGNELYALNEARFAIKNDDRAYIVEGYTDVLRLHSIEVLNSVATGGTALSLAQVKLLRRYTNKVTLVFDGDKAGQSATDRNAEILIKNQFHVSVIGLPEKQDPDSLFTSKELFLQYNDKQVDYIIFKTSQYAVQFASDPVKKSDAIKRISLLISNYDKTKQEVYIDFVAEKIKPKKAWQDAIKELSRDEPKKSQRYNIPEHVSLSNFNRWGFYVENNCYVFRNKKGDDYVHHSNFVMTPLFHIESPINAKRLYEIKNRHNLVKIIELPQRDMVSITAFKLQIESLGNFLWTGGESELNKLKAWLYEKTKSCKEIMQLGWQREGFFCWGNGIFNGDEFVRADKYGIVQHDSKYFYIPACSDIYDGDDTLFEFERHFIHNEGNITLYEYATKYYGVFGHNGIITLSFYFACLFMDIVAKRFDKFPILNMYGQKGSGKNTCAESILYMFGRKGKVPNLHNSSKPSIADHVATSSNAVCVLDEYRNDLEMEKRELLKGFWDKTGRTRMNMDKDKKKETSKVNQGIIVCGQQIATADIALFSRFIALGFSKTVFSFEDKKLFEELEQLNKQGLTQITHQLLKHRELFTKYYNKTVDSVSDEFRKLLGTIAIETRIFNNWLTVASAYATVAKMVELPFKIDEIMQLFVEMMIEQNKETARNDDLGIFWKTIQYLISSNVLFEEGDYRVVYAEKMERTFKEDGKWQKSDIVFQEPQKLLYLSVSRVFGLYKSQALREGDKPLPDATVEYYLKNSPAFICDTKKVSFKKMDAKSGYQEYDERGNKKYTSTTAFVFYLDKLNLNLDTEAKSVHSSNM
ncbi:DNA primase [Carboxylicivirga sp. N1Y90]|uniref:DNA primase n=1 Tax=Carboxylicivirga fragile TaxID=3417571 RepID=UPI003D333D71|nr:DNA primase [Marinilabiliaceae bacterium N1Y90]